MRRPRMPKNIVLLADGTGNSSASPFKTNVWRLYQAVDITGQSGDPQVVYYNDGVGTGSFRPLVLLGLALGIGLARNVKDLYAFACRNYEPGDNIYLFGFSRGAFTVRILAGLILRCGLVTASSDAELVERVQLAYDEYKRDMARRATKTRPWLIAGHFLGGHETGNSTDHIEFNFPQVFPCIRFMGVWDTVDAYGMPVDELKTAIDRHIWPMTLADRELSPHIEQACHALSLDDERPTFRPVLWTDPQGDQRLTQIWFAGVHADVGGGYPDDGLANVTLQWMMDEAVGAGLRLYPNCAQECCERANGAGEQHDSRAGLAGYYRYGPRNVDALCNDPDHGVQVALPIVHQTVIDRIREWRVRYAPVSFPGGHYTVAWRPGGAVGAPTIFRGPFEVPPDIELRDHEMTMARDAVTRREATYFATVALTLVLAALPAIDWLTGKASWRSGTTAIPVWSDIGKLVSRALTWILTLDVLPGWANAWCASFARHPMLFLLAGSLLLWMFVRHSAILQDRIFARAEYAWRRL